MVVVTIAFDDASEWQRDVHVLDGREEWFWTVTSLFIQTNLAFVTPFCHPEEWGILALLLKGIDSSIRAPRSLLPSGWQKVDSRSSLNGWKSLNSFINQVTIRLRQQRKRSLGDAIIAATALIHRLPVVTNNVNDFSTVEGLTIIPLQSILAGTA